MNITAIESAGARSGGITGELSGKKILLLVVTSNPDGNLMDYAALLALPLILTIITILYILIKNSQRKSRQIEILKAEILIFEKDSLKLTTQNDWLVTEMHHRVKNNLQILSSLINSQLSYITEKKGRDTLSNIKHRLHALTLVHQKLFQNATASSIEISSCIKDLVEYLTDEFKSNDRVSFKLELIPLTVDVSFAIPFELVINELLTNTLKFAFPGKKSGTVKITLIPKDNNSYQLLYADNGIGLPENVDLRSEGSLGRKLIMGLSRQIKAQITVNNASGLEVKMNFNLPQTS